MYNRITVIGQSASGRNQRFHDNITGADMTRKQFVRAIERGGYSTYHVRVVNGVKTPAANPDGNPRNNLG